MAMPQAMKRGANVAKERVIIMGAAGRDFHNFNLLFRNDPNTEVIAFTANQIPRIDGREYPDSLTGTHYKGGIPIHSEDELEALIQEFDVTMCMLAYSDLPYEYAGRLATRVLAAGSDFTIASHRDTMCESKKPVIAVTAVRTGCGKSQTTRYVCDCLKKDGLVPVVVRHPMPYGDLGEMVVQRFATMADCDKYKITIEEREEYEQHIKMGTVVYAGVDYGLILKEAEKEADVIIFDGGNNDTSFYKPDLWICVADPHRPNHEVSFYPGAINFKCADVIIINKVNTAPAGSVDTIVDNARKFNADARIVMTNSEVVVADPSLIVGKRVLLVEDGPTLTHGGMAFGSGRVAAEKYGAKEIVDPRGFAKGSIADVYAKYPHLGKLIPAMGYWDEQIKDLENTINSVPDVDTVIIATPMDLGGLINIERPSVVASYHSTDTVGDRLSDVVHEFVQREQSEGRVGQEEDVDIEM